MLVLKKYINTLKGQNKDNFITSAKELTEKVLGEEVSTQPIIDVEQNLVDAESIEKLNTIFLKKYKNIVLGISASEKIRDGLLIDLFQPLKN